MNKQAHRRRRAPVLSLLSLTLLGALSMPAFAADPLCLDTNGNPSGETTTQGQEHGSDNTTCDAASAAYGIENNASAFFSAAFGLRNTANGNWSSAFGRDNVASGYGSSAFGSDNVATGSASNAFGLGNHADGQHSSALGDQNTASAIFSSAVGYRNTASGFGSNAFGDYNTASGDRSSAFGYGSQALNIGSTAIGYLAVADRDYAVAVGRTGGEHQIIHLANGTEDTDAVNVRQLKAAIAGGMFDPTAIVNALGGGAAWAGGIFTAPTYTIQGVGYGSVGAALAAIDGWMTSNANGVQYDDASHATATLGGVGGTQVKNVADGVDSMDAVNKGQMEAGDAATLTAAKAHATAGDAATLTASKAYTDSTATQTLASAKSYTDQKFAAWNDTFTQYQQQVDKRFAQTDKRIDQIGAMGSAMTHMAVNAANGNSAKGRIAIGVGTQGSQGAVSIGYGKRLGDRGSFSLGASFSSGESSVGGGFGIDL
jgi:autotransporter adhesin